MWAHGRSSGKEGGEVKEALSAGSSRVKIVKRDSGADYTKNQMVFFGLIVADGNWVFADTDDVVVVGEDTDFGVACQALARRLGEELRAAKSARLSCGEVLLPVHLLPRAAANILASSEKEPCGLR